MAEPTTNNVCRTVKRAVNRIVNEDEEMSGTCRSSSGENEWPVPNTGTGGARLDGIAAKRTCTSTSSTLCSVLEDLSMPQQQSEGNTAQSSYLYVYSTALQCASLDSWDEAESLLLLGASLEMMYQFGTVHQDHTPSLRAPLGELSTSSMPANNSTDGRALIHQATLFVRSHLAMTNDEHIIDRSNSLAFILQKLPEKWIDRTYSRIEQYQAKYPEPCFPGSIRVILRNAASLEEETSLVPLDS